METKIIKAVFGGGTSTVTNKRTRTDYGQVLEIIGVDLPDTFECIFSNSATSAGVGKKQIGSAHRVLIPDEYLATGQTIYAWVLVHDTEDDGRHMYSIRIPVADMPDTSPAEPTPVEQSVISQAITALNSAVTTTTQKAQEASDSADRAEQAAEGVEGYVERAESAQQAAESARDRATQAETSARTSAATATEKASEAISSATTASQSAMTAETASESAQEYATASAVSASASAVSASQASEHASTAGSKATEASGYASNANASAQTASQKSLEASQSASTAVQAKTDAESAKTASQTAQTASETARDEAVTAKTDAESARDEAQEIVDGISGKVEQIDSNTTRIESLEDDRYKPYPTDIASGSIASFPDGADGIPLKSCIVQIEPVQDLHGYDAPWPAGGGTNQWDEQWEVGAINFYTGELEDGTNAIRSKNYIPVTGGGVYQIVFPNPNSNTMRIIQYDANKEYVRYATANSANGMTKTLDASTAYLKFYIGGSYGSTYSNDIAINYPSTVTTYSPYENICPISGWTGVEVQRTGFNVWDEEWEVGDLSYSGQPIAASDRIRTKNFIHVIPNTAYYFKTGVSGQTSWQLFGCYYDKDKNFISTFYRRNSRFTMPSNCHYIKWTTTGGYGTTYNNDISIDYPSTDHDYHPYVGQTYPITFPSEAGIVYGAYVDVTGGELVVDRAIVDLGTLTWNYYTGTTNLPVFYARLIGMAISGTNSAVCSALKCTNWQPLGLRTDKTICPHPSLDNIYVADADRTDHDVSSFTASVTGVQYCYKLATPIHYPLTPTEIKTLLGTNNLWADTGDVSVEYRADTTLYIKRLTDSDTDMIVDSNIVSGQYFMVGNDLYKATVNIASGASVIVGTNATKVSLAQALNEINA